MEPAPRCNLFRVGVTSASLAVTLACALVLCAGGAVGMRTAVSNAMTQLSTSPPLIKMGASRTNICPSGFTRIVDEAECRAVMPLLVGGDPDHYEGSYHEDDWPAGCYRCWNADNCADGVYFNPHQTGAAHQGAHPICKQGFEIKYGKTLFVGDSDVDYWHSFANAVPESYNVGIGGNTCKDALQEIDFLLGKFKPAWVVLVCGENDLASDASVSKTFKRWTELVEKIHATGARIVMMGTKPESSTKDLHKKYKKYDEKIKEYVLSAAKTISPPPVQFVDAFKAFKAMGNPNSLYDPNERPDFLHLGPKGYAHWDRWAALAKGGMLGCVIWEGDKCTAKAPLVSVLADSTNACPEGFVKLTTEQECHAATGLVGLEGNTWQDSEDEGGWPAGCYYCGPNVDGCNEGTWFNKNAVGGVVQGARVYCKHVSEIF